MMPYFRARMMAAMRRQERRAERRVWVGLRRRYTQARKRAKKRGSDMAERAYPPRDRKVRMPRRMEGVVARLARRLARRVVREAVRRRRAKLRARAVG